MEKKINLGWIRDLPDQRDYVYNVPYGTLKVIAKQTDLRGIKLPIYDQLCLGSCTANAIASAVEYAQIKEKKLIPFSPSRLFIYYNERVLEKTTQYDNGAQIRNGIKTVVSQGVCPETEWPYKVGTCNIVNYDSNGNPTVDVGTAFKTKPFTNCYNDALKFQTLQYMSVPKTLSQLKGCITAGYPFVMGFTVYESFEKIGINGLMPSPSYSEIALGGHAVLCVGYDDSKACFIMQNSWGKNWGDKGYFYMPYSFILSTNCSDFWTIRLVEI